MNIIRKNKIPVLAFTSISTVVYFLFAYILNRENTLVLFGAFAILAGMYYFILNKNELLSEKYHHFVIVSFGLRILFLFSIPALSDDFYRFIWDGRLIQEGLKPIGYLPNKIIIEEIIGKASNMELFQKMNSPDYYSVYPPVMQLLFFISAKLSFGHNAIAIYFFRLFIILAEFGTFIYLKKIIHFLKIEKTKIFIYLLNPLVIIELTGNLHFEGVMIFFLTASFYYLMINRYIFSAALLALAISPKMIPLIFLPLIVKKIGWKNGIIYSIFSVGIIIVLFLPFIDRLLISNISESLRLYFQKFEFNASIYYLLREIGYKMVGYNTISTIGKVLPIVSTSIILYISFRVISDGTWQDFFKRALNILFIYYLLSLIVHPWYVSLLVLITVFVENRFAILWSILIFGSYFTYNSVPYRESLWVNGIEYSIVILFLLYENKKLKAINISNKNFPLTIRNNFFI